MQCWQRLHLRQAREIELSVIQVIRHGAQGSARDPAGRVGVCGKATKRLPWLKSVRPIACAPPRSMATDWTNKCSCGISRAFGPRADGTLDAGGGLCAQPIGVGSSAGSSSVPPLGASPLGAALAAGKPRYANAFARVGYPCSTPATTRKSTRTPQGVPSATSCASSGHSQNKQNE
jgi:hypothetical protein